MSGSDEIVHQLEKKIHPSVLFFARAVQDCRCAGARSKLYDRARGMVQSGW